MEPTGLIRLDRSFRQPTVTLNRRRDTIDQAISTTTLDETGELLVAPLPSRRASRRSLSASRFIGGGRTTSAWIKDDGDASAEATESTATTKRRSVVLGSDVRTPRGIKGLRLPSSGSEHSSPEGAEGGAARAESSPQRDSSERDGPRKLRRTTSVGKAAGAFIGLIGRKLKGSSAAVATTAEGADASDGLEHVGARRRARLLRAQRQRASVFSSAAMSQAAAYAASHVGREGAPSGAAHAGGPDAAAPQLLLRIDADGNYEHNLGHATHSERKERTWGRLTRRISLGVEDFAKNVRRGGELQVGTLARGGLVNVSTARGLSGEASLSPRQRERQRKASAKKKEQDVQAARDAELEKRLGFKPKTFTLSVRIDRDSTENLGLELRQRKRGGIMVAPSLFNAVKTNKGKKRTPTIVGAAGDVEVVAIHKGLLEVQHGPTCVLLRARARARADSRGNGSRLATPALFAAVIDKDSPSHE
jgi:hypothetical protein